MDGMKKLLAYLSRTCGMAVNIFKQKKFKEITKYTVGLMIWISGVLSGVVLFVIKNTSPLYGVIQSYFAGFLFFIVVVVIPELRRKNAVHSFMVNRYKDFRLDLINIFLQAAGVWEHGRAEELLRPEKFKAFFSTKKDGCKVELLYLAESGIDDSPSLLNDIEVAFKHFSNEIEFAMFKVVSDDTRMYEELNFLRRRLYNLFNLSCYKADPSKYLGQFFWDTLGWWNEIYGDRPSDWIADSIEKLRR